MATPHSTQMKNLVALSTGPGVSISVVGGQPDGSVLAGQTVLVLVQAQGPNSLSIAFFTITNYQAPSEFGYATPSVDNPTSIIFSKNWTPMIKGAYTVQAQVDEAAPNTGVFTAPSFVVSVR